RSDRSVNSAPLLETQTGQGARSADTAGRAPCPLALVNVSNKEDRMLDTDGPLPFNTDQPTNDTPCDDFSAAANIPPPPLASSPGTDDHAGHTPRGSRRNRRTPRPGSPP